MAPTESAILAGVQADIDTAFGGGVNPALETPQGQLASSTTAIIGDTNAQFLALANGVDPAFASGRLQDAIARIYFLERNPAEPTAVIATCVGASGTVIPIGSLASSTDGNLYISTAAATIPIGGTVDVPFACTVNGPIPCPAATLTSIYRAIPGWDTVTNATDGVLGNEVESRAAFEARRAASVALNSVGPLSAVLAKVLNVPDVLDAYAAENDTATPIVNGAITLNPNSIYVCVAGGADQAIGEAIWSKKMPGCAYTGDTLVTVTDTNPLYSIPYPTYAVYFQTATSLPIFFKVTIADSTSVPSTALADIQAALLAAFVGSDGGPRARIGSTIFASRFYSAVANLGPWAQIVSIFIGTTGPAAALSVSAGIDEAPTLDAGDITLVLV